MPGPKILLVDDEVNILNALKRLLIPENFDVISTSSPFEALHMVSKEEFTIVMSDHRMPHMEGTALLHKIKEISPASIRILLTGYADLNAATSAINDGEVYRFLAKPWDDEELVKTLKQAVDQFEALKNQKKAYSQNSELKERNQSLIEKNVNQAFQNKRLCHELDQSYLISVNALAKSIKLYEPRLWHHSLIVKIICQKIAKLIGLPREKATQLEVAGLLHDIGKIGIPHAILRKSKKALTPEEIELQQAHPLNGYSIISQISYFQEAAILIRYHHEHFDGSGYPDGLAGTMIPAGARIIRVVDAYAKRKKGHPFTMDPSYHEAIAFLESQSGAQLDPEAIRLLKECIASEAVQGKSPIQQETATYWQQAVMSEKDKVSSLESPPKTIPVKTDDSPKKPISSESGEALLIEQADTLLADLEEIEIIPYTPSANSSRIQHTAEPSSDILMISKNEDARREKFLEDEDPGSIDDTSEDWLPLELSAWEIDSFTANELAEEPPEIHFPDEPLIATQALKPTSESASTMSAAPIQGQSLPQRTTRQIDERAESHQSVSVNSPVAHYAPKAEPIRKNTYKGAYPGAKQKYQEVVIQSSYLCAGMVLSRNLVTPQGVKLLQKGTILHPEQMKSVKSYLKRNDLEDLEIYILRPC